MRRALAISTPPVSSMSSMLSMLEESEPVRFTRGAISLILGSNSLSKPGVRASAQLRFPSIVLISPLWASRRNGWASGQRGMVLVENR